MRKIPLLRDFLRVDKLVGTQAECEKESYIFRNTFDTDFSLPDTCLHRITK